MPFSKAITATALFMEGNKSDRRTLALVNGYWELRRVSVPPVEELAEHRRMLLWSPWFTANHFAQVHSDITEVLKVFYRPDPAASKYGSPDEEFWPSAKDCSDEERLWRRLLNNVENTLQPGKSRMSMEDQCNYLLRGRFHHPVNDSGHMPDFVIRPPVTVATARIIKILDETYDTYTQCNSDFLAQAITSAISQGMLKVLKALLGVLHRLAFRTLQPCLTKEHVKLAASLCEIEILKTLLDQQCWFQISHIDVQTIVEDLCARKPKNWHTAAGMLIKDLGVGKGFQRKKQKSVNNDIWKMKLAAYGVSNFHRAT